MLRTDVRADDWIASARAVSIEDAAAFVGVKLKRSGADLVAPCPAGCCTKDGFVVTPQGGVFLCRQSGEGGDSIALVMHAAGCSFNEACETLTGETRPKGAREETAEERQAREARAKERAETAKRRREESYAAELSTEDRQRREIARILSLMVPIDGTRAEAYLRARGLIPGAWNAGLGFLPDAPYRDDEGKIIARLPTMIAPIVYATTGRVIGLHRTYLDPIEPRKFKAPNGGGSKKIYGRAAGGLIPLGEIGETLAIAEGIETAAAWLQHPDLGGEMEGVSLAAAVSLGNMSGACAGTFPHPEKVNERTGKPIPVPNGIPYPSAEFVGPVIPSGMILPSQVRQLILLGDGDSEPLSTRARVLAAARRHRAQGIEVSIHFAPSGHDFASLGASA